MGIFENMTDKLVEKVSKRETIRFTAEQMVELVKELFITNANDEFLKQVEDTAKGGNVFTEKRLASADGRYIFEVGNLQRGVAFGQSKTVWIKDMQANKFYEIDKDKNWKKFYQGVCNAVRMERVHGLRVSPNPDISSTDKVQTATESGNAQNTYSAQAAQPTETSQPVPEAQVAQPTETSQPVPEAQVTQPTESSQPVPEVQVAQPPETSQPVPEAEVAQPTETPQPVPEAQPIQKPQEAALPSNKPEIQPSTETQSNDKISEAAQQPRVVDSVPADTYANTQPNQIKPAPAAGSASQGIVALILGIVSLILFLLPILGLPCSIVGLIFGIIGKTKNAKYSVVGIVLSSIGLLLVIVNAIGGVILFSRYYI